MVGWRWFPDHHAYSAAELAALGRAAERLSARLVTTEKDAWRLGAGIAVETLPVRLEFEAAGALEALLARRLAGFRETFRAQRFDGARERKNFARNLSARARPRP